MENSEIVSVAKLIRLKNGDDLVSEAYEYADDTGDYYTIINPLKVMYVPSTATGYMQIVFVPWVYPRICDIQEFNIPKEEVLLYYDVSERMDEYYWESVDSYLEIRKDQSQEKIKEEQEPEEDYEALKEALEALTGKRTLH
jgi:hypothetical protein